MSSYSRDTYVTGILREEGLKFIQRHNLSLHQATKDDIKWLWRDFNGPKGLSYGDYNKLEDVNAYIKLQWSFLEKRYPIDLADWIYGWYNYWPEEIACTGRRPLPSDYSLFFTIVGVPVKVPPNMTFHEMICKWAIRLSTHLRTEYKERCWKNPKARARVLEGRTPPLDYRIIRPHELLSYIRLKEIRRRKQTGEPYGDLLIGTDEEYEDLVEAKTGGD